MLPGVQRVRLVDIPWGGWYSQVSWGENCPCLRATQQSLTHPELWAQAVSLAGWVTRRQGLGLLHSCRLMPYGGERSTQERWGLWEGGEGLSPGTLLVVPPAVSPEPQTPVCPPTLQFAPSHPPSTRAQGEWLWTGFCALAF